ncbi:MAG: ATP-dependent helicase HrpB [Pseudomonadota bacterium]
MMADLSALIDAQDLPIQKALPALGKALNGGSNAVLIAPPGAGKTTLVPLFLLDAQTAPWRKGGRIIVLEPRRLAARAAAQRMAHLLSEEPGQTVGYQVRFDAKLSKQTQIEVLTEGVFLRRLSADPALEGVAAVLFDECHERSLNTDLAMALCKDAQGSLRNDLRLLPMSATLDAQAMATFLGAPVIESQGRTFPVDIFHQERSPDTPLDEAVVKAVRGGLAETAGSLLVFLPGRREIERSFDALEGTLPPNVKALRLYGALDPKEQEAALRAPKAGERHVILASSIAETSLTIPAVSRVIDGGLARQPVFDPRSGTTRLDTVRASKAAINQRAGRAGRLGPGSAVRLWRKEQTAALPDHTPPEIEVADLSALLFALADWGVGDARALNWITPPPEPALKEARGLLFDLGLMSASGTLTAFGRHVFETGLDPRLGTIVIASHPDLRYRVACLTLLLQEPGVGGRSIDLADRLKRLETSNDPRSRAIKRSAARIADAAATNAQPQAANEGGLHEGRSDDAEIGSSLLVGFPDRVAQRTGTSQHGAARFRLANGRGVEVDGDDPLAKEAYIVVADLAGRAAGARVLAAAAVTKEAIGQQLTHLIQTVSDKSFNPQRLTVEAVSQPKLGALTLGAAKKTVVPLQDAADTVFAHIRKQGLAAIPAFGAVEPYLARLAFAEEYANALGLEGSKTQHSSQRRFDKDGLLAALDAWLGPFLSGKHTLADITAQDLRHALLFHAAPLDQAKLDRALPDTFSAPSGSTVPITYHSWPTVTIRPQELFGLNVHPTVGTGPLPIALQLVSPAGRPIQITRDLPGFWAGSWRDVRADLRGRYPKHPWPENPITEAPTARAKPRR